MTPTDQIAALMEGLSEAQRACVLAMKPDQWQRPKDIPAYGSTLHALWWHETLFLVTRDIVGDEPHFSWKLCADGLALRRHLLTQEERGK